MIGSGDWQFDQALERIAKLARRRELQLIGFRLVDLARDPSADPDDTIARALDHLSSTARGERGVQWVSATDLLAAADVKREDLIGEGLLPRRGLLMLAGPPKSGKTILMLQAAVAAAGRPFLCFNTRRSKVLILSDEGGSPLLKERLAQMGDGEHMARILCASMDSGPPLLLDNPSDRARLISECKRRQVDLVLVDPLIRFHALDENSTQDMGQLMRHLAEVRHAASVAMILVHHTRKSGANSQTGSAGEARGSSVLHGELDSAMVLSSRRSSSDYTLHFELRWAPEPPALRLELNPEALAFHVAGHLEGSNRKLSPGRLREILTENGPATVAELGILCGTSDRTVKEYLRALEREGAATAKTEAHGRKRWHLTTQVEEPVV